MNDPSFIIVESISAGFGRKVRSENVKYDSLAITNPNYSTFMAAPVQVTPNVMPGGKKFVVYKKNWVLIIRLGFGTINVFNRFRFHYGCSILGTVLYQASMGLVCTEERTFSMYITWRTTNVWLQKMQQASSRLHLLCNLIELKKSVWNIKHFHFKIARLSICGWLLKLQNPPKFIPLIYLEKRWAVFRDFT